MAALDCDTSTGQLDYFEWCASFLNNQVVPTTTIVPASESDYYSQQQQIPSPNSPSMVSPGTSPQRAPQDILSSMSYLASGLPSGYMPHAQYSFLNPYMAPVKFYTTIVNGRPMVQLAPTQPTHWQSQQFESQLQSQQPLHHHVKSESPSPPSSPPEAPAIIERLPEFLYATPDLSALTRTDLDNCFQFPQPFHRNCYEVMRLKIPQQAAANYEGYRIYIQSKLGYSGNAKRFKHAPDTNERALVLEGQLLNSNLTPITQCQTCEEYFKDSQKWVLLIKNNLPMHVNNGEFSIQMKLMCCSTHHHNSPFYFHLSLLDNVENKVVMRCLFSAVVKQWKNLGSSSQGTAPTKRRKTEPT